MGLSFRLAIVSTSFMAMLGQSGCKRKSRSNISAIVDTSSGQNRAFSLVGARYSSTPMTQESVLAKLPFRFVSIQCSGATPVDTVNLISGIELASAAEQLFVDPNRVMIPNNDLTLSEVDGCKILPGTKAWDINTVATSMNKLVNSAPSSIDAESQALFLAFRGGVDPKNPKRLSPQVAHLQKMTLPLGVRLQGDFTEKFIAMDAKFNPCAQESKEISFFKCVSLGKDLMHFAPGTKKYTYDDVVLALSSTSKGFGLANDDEGDVTKLFPVKDSPFFASDKKAAESGIDDITVGTVLSTDKRARNDATVYAGNNSLGNPVYIDKRDLDAGVTSRLRNPEGILQGVGPDDNKTNMPFTYYALNKTDPSSGAVVFSLLGGADIDNPSIKRNNWNVSVPGKTQVYDDGTVGIITTPDMIKEAFREVGVTPKNTPGYDMLVNRGYKAVIPALSAVDMRNAEKAKKAKEQQDALARKQNEQRAEREIRYYTQPSQYQGSYNPPTSGGGSTARGTGDSGPCD